jgi:glycosyltransferase involved in cell wall biosynthesis
VATVTAPPHAHPTVSVVVPTRNRPASLSRLLGALARQTRRPDEVIVVDASDDPASAEALARSHPGLAITTLAMAPGVCAQRNAGIRRATGSHVLICDDDIEPPPEYLASLTSYVRDHLDAGAVSGVLREAEGEGRFSTGLPVPSLRHLCFAWLFQLTVWADVEAARAGPLGRAPLAALRRWYRGRGNTWSLAGWPLVTQRDRTILHTATYGLGASLVRRDWLLASPFDERLGAHGIGDNYGVALGFPGAAPVAVLLDLPVLHHRERENRPTGADVFFRRALALDYFLRTSPRFRPSARLWLAWSLLGQALVFAARGPRDRLPRALRAAAMVLSGSNPLLAARSGV